MTSLAAAHFCCPSSHTILPLNSFLLLVVCGINQRLLDFKEETLITQGSWRASTLLST
jgi:hypothetical protein